MPHNEILEITRQSATIEIMSEEKKGPRLATQPSVIQAQAVPKPATKLSSAELAQEGRDFLHDISNPLAIACGLLEGFQLDIKRENIKLTERQTRKLEKISKAMLRIDEQIKNYRKRLIEAQSKT
jgi:hypothetical protein